MKSCLVIIMVMVMVMIMVLVDQRPSLLFPPIFGKSPRSWGMLKLIEFGLFGAEYSHNILPILPKGRRHDFFENYDISFGYGLGHTPPDTGTSLSRYKHTPEIIL